jgi:2-keto-4-pentenoate hydratase
MTAVESGSPVESVVAAAAERLWQAQATRTPCAPVRDLVEVPAVDTAYAIAQANVARIVAERGWRLNGHKIGLTSPAVQRQLGVDRPDFGVLFAELAHTSGEEVPVTDLLQPRVEAEVALVLRHDLDERVHTIADVISAVDYVLPALEIVDSRVAGWDITFVDTVADNASAGRYVLGTVPVRLDGLDLAAIEMTMTVNGESASTGRGSACLGNPLIAARWLADTMSQAGTPLRAGGVVLTGALGPMTAVAPGDEVAATITGVGTVTATFAKVAS